MVGRHVESVCVRSIQVYSCHPSHHLHANLNHLVIPINLLTCIHSHRWLGEYVCIGHTSIQIMPFIVTEFTHLLIAFDRLVSSCHCSHVFLSFDI